MSAIEAIAALARYPHYDTTWSIAVPAMVAAFVFLCSIPLLVVIESRRIRRIETQGLSTAVALALMVAMFGNAANLAMVIHQKYRFDGALAIQASEICAIALRGIDDGIVMSIAPEQDAAMDRLCRGDAALAQRGPAPPVSSRWAT